LATDPTTPRAKRGAHARGAQAHRTGLAAEDTAARLAESRGLAVLERRYRTPHGEIDLIVSDPAGTLIVFVEVKARRSAEEAAHAITARQWARLEGAALHYMGVYHTRTNQSDTAASSTGPDLRFDVVLVGRDGLARWIENARGFDEF